jgi:protein-disulfide isomerase
MSNSSTKQRAASRREERQRQSQTRLIVGVVIGALVITGVLILISIPRGGSSSTAVADYSGLNQAIDNSGTAIGFSIGEDSAPVTVIEYSDFSCPHCYDLSQYTDRLIEEYVRDGSLRIVYKPVSFVNPPYSIPAAQAAVCAAQQGKFWEMQDQIWSLYAAKSPAGYTRPNLVDQAVAIGLDQNAFETCYSSEETLAQVRGVLDEVQALGIQGTPTLYVNGQQINYAGPEAFYNQMVTMIEAQAGS